MVNKYNSFINRLVAPVLITLAHIRLRESNKCLETGARSSTYSYGYLDENDRAGDIDYSWNPLVLEDIDDERSVATHKAK